MNVRIESSWQQVLQDEFDKPYFEILTDFVRSEYAKKQCFPKGMSIFNAFDLCPFNEVKVVILGQDPYHGEGQANGLSFSVNTGIKLPPSLVNIYKEIETDMGIKMSSDGDLRPWARQGVLLLNATLTVEAHKPGSHQNKGWEEFTDAVITRISQNKEHCVFLLWGNFAQQKSSLIDKSKHLILKAKHPSPLSAYGGFFGCKHFSKTNTYLTQHGKSAIDWKI